MLPAIQRDVKRTREGERALLKEYDVKDGFLKQCWEDFYEGNEYLFPYSSTVFNKTYLDCYKFKTSMWKYKKRFYILFADGKPRIIVPLLIRKKRMEILGGDTGTGAMDFIYPEDVTDEDFRKLFRELEEKFPGHELRLDKVNERSRLSDYLLRHPSGNCTVTEKRTCVAIDFDGDYDSYYKGLSKSSRQNLRTSYNKMGRNDVTHELKVCAGPDLEESVLKRQQAIYNQREERREGRGKGFFAKLRQRYTNPTTISSLRMRDSLNFSFYMNGKLTAYMKGYITNFNSIVIPRLAIDATEFGKYSPGKLMINEAVKYMLEHTDIRCLDLSKGDEKYKYDMGGDSHYNYSFKMSF